MLSASAIADAMPGVASLEAEEPLVGCWRYHGGVRTRIAPLRTLAGIFRSRFLQRHETPAPAPGQVVAFAGAPTPAHLGSLLPILNALKERGCPAFLITTVASASARTVAAHTGHVSAEALIGRLPLTTRLRNLHRAWTLGRRLQAGLVPLGCANVVGWLERGMSMRDAVRSWGPPACGVLIDGDHRALRAGFIIGAQACGLPVYSLQHGFFSVNQLPIFSDRLLCWGQHFVDDAASLGVPRQKLAAIGCPRWDGLLKLRAGPRSDEFRRRMGSTGKGPLVLVISNTHGARSHPEPYAAFRRGLKRLLESGIEVALRLHPLESDLGYYVEGISTVLLSRIVVVDQSADFHETVRHADVIYHVFSAGALEAMQLGVPVLFSRNPGPKQLCNLPDTGGGMWCPEDDAVRLCNALGKAGECRSEVLARQEAFLHRSFANLGNATEAVVEELLRSDGKA